MLSVAVVIVLTLYDAVGGEKKMIIVKGAKQNRRGMVGRPSGERSSVCCLSFIQLHPWLVN